MNMSTIYYHVGEKEWYQCDDVNGLFFGKKDSIITYAGSKQKHWLPFLVKRDGRLVGPLVGILTGTSKDNTFIGNLKVLKKILLSLQDNGALGIVITPHSLRKHFVQGFTFYPPLQKWIKVQTPLPHTVYNRIPYRHLEETQDFNDVATFLKMNDITFFNPYFFSKWKIHQILQKNKFISSFLPDTALLVQKKDLEQMIAKHRDLYVKCANGSKGIGLYRIKKGNKEITVESPNGKQRYPTLNTFWEKNKNIFTQEDYIAQKAIQSDTFKGKRYDLRLLCHFIEKKHSISGIGVRLSGENEVTTHVPNGGSIIPYEAVCTRFNEDILQNLVFEIGKELMERTGEFIGEFSIDLGRSALGDIFIFEVNSKPMVFDEVDIHQKGLENLTKLLIMKTTKA